MSLNEEKFFLSLIDFNKNSETKRKLYQKIGENIRINYFDNVDFNSVQKFIN